VEGQEKGQGISGLERSPKTQQHEMEPTWLQPHRLPRVYVDSIHPSHPGYVTVHHRLVNLYASGSRRLPTQEAKSDWPRVEDLQVHGRVGAGLTDGRPGANAPRPSPGAGDLWLLRSPSARASHESQEDQETRQSWQGSRHQSKFHPREKESIPMGGADRAGLTP